MTPGEFRLSGIHIQKQALRRALSSAAQTGHIRFPKTPMPCHGTENGVHARNEAVEPNDLCVKVAQARRLSYFLYSKMPAGLPAFHLLKLPAAGAADECIHFIIDGLY